MTYLVACGLEVGGQPWRVAAALNRCGVPARYLPLAAPGAGHDSTAFHYGGRREPWDLTGRLPGGGGAAAVVAALARLREQEGVTGAFATGAETDLLGRAGIPYWYWSYGSDLDQLSFAPIWPEGYPAWRRPWAWTRFALGFRRRQRRAIRGAEAVMISPYQREALRRVRPRAPLFFLPHLLPAAPGLGELRRQKARDAAAAAAEIGARRYVFSSTRHVWCGGLASRADRKGNDVALRAFARWAAAADDGTTRLVLVRKGPDAAASAALAGELGIGDRVTWLEEMPRERLERWYRGAALCLGQFGTPVLTYAALEPLAQATACLSWTGPRAAAVPWYEDPPPVEGSLEPEELAAAIGRLLGDATAREGAEEAGWRWVRSNCSEEAFAEAFVGAVGGGRPPAPSC